MDCRAQWNVLSHHFNLQSSKEIIHKLHMIADENTVETNVAFYMKEELPTVCVSAAWSWGRCGWQGVCSVSPYFPSLGIHTWGECAGVCVCTGFLPTSTSGVSLTVEGRLADLCWDAHSADLHTHLRTNLRDIYIYDFILVESWQTIESLNYSHEKEHELHLHKRGMNAKQILAAWRTGWLVFFCEGCGLGAVLKIY